MANPLVLGKEQCEALAHLREQAAANPLDMREVMPTLTSETGKRAHFERMKTYTIRLPVMFAVTFTIEINHPGGTMRHMSMSSGRPGKAPIPHAIILVMRELGFNGDLENCSWWKEDIGGGDIAINVVQPIAVVEESRT